jgi:outer membrane protein OmpA-like peptidoglycan-associated protein
MGEGALNASSEETEDVARRDTEPHEDSPAIRLLDALRSGDDLGVLAVCGEATIVSAENMAWSCQGRDEIHRMLVETRERFPGITFESRTRHIGFGLVIDEARVVDELFEEPDSGAAAEPADASSGNRAALDTSVTDETAEVARPDVHPMWDEPATEARNVLAVWKHRAEEPQAPIRLNMPVRVTVRHDDLQVHEVALSFPAALLKRALGMHVDPFEMSLSEVQSAFIAPVGAGFTTYALARPELKLVPPAPAEPAESAPSGEPPRRRRGRLLVPVLLALVALLGGGAWYAVQGRGGDNTAGADLGSHAPTPTPTPSPSASAQPSTQPSASHSPTVTHAKPSNGPTRKPNVTLKSDLAFGFNSSTLSREAKAAIEKVARQVRHAGLTGKIYVDGYTDNLGSAAYGVILSQRRADAVSNYLGSQLVGVPGITIVSIAHGEADPIADNSTAAGRRANRRVTITLPKP